MRKLHSYLHGHPIVLIMGILCISAAACDTPMPHVITTPTQATVPTEPLPAVQPVAQGWIIDLANLTKENNYRLDFDVLGTGGWAVGALSVAATGDNGYQRDAGLISSVQVSGTLSNTQPGNLTQEVTAGDPRISQPGSIYEKTASGWQLRITVASASVDEHPSLPDGSTGQVPVFRSLKVHVEILGNNGAVPYLGITAEPVSRSRAAAENLRGPGLQLLDHGVVIREVQPGSPASIAGLKVDDVIQALGGVPIDEFTSLSVLLARHKVGETVSLDVVRETRLLKVNVALQEHP
jgi:hypothetical protein